MFGANSNGRQPNNTAYIKTFVDGFQIGLWKTMMYLRAPIPTRVITPVSVENLLIPGNFYLNGNFVHSSDMALKENVTDVDEQITDKLMKLKLRSFSYKSDSTKKKHYGFIAQEFEEVYNELVEIKPDDKYENVKGINYLEIVPLLVGKVQKMQQEIDELRELTNGTK